jgi:nitrate/nitrite-specific signal transduction histidine kinase
MTGVLLLIYNRINHEIQNTTRKLKKVSTDIGALLKVYRTMNRTNEQKQINEQLYKFNLSLQHTTEDKDVSKETLEKIRKITKSDYIAFRSNTNPHLSGKSGVGSMKENNAYDEPGDIIDYTLKWGRSYNISITNKDLPEEFSNFCLINNEDLQTIYSIPLILNNKVLGGLLIGFRREFYIGEEWQNIVRTIGQMLSIYLENKQLHEQIENSATILERKRISREIHDGIAQNIGFINIELSRLKKMMEKQEYERVIQEISVVKAAVDESYTELRETLDQLGDKDSYSKNIVEWMKLFLQDFEMTNRIKTEFKCEVNEVFLTENQQVQLTRVIQEILNNIRKHAKASHVKVKISQANNDLNIFIKDNGVGFEPTLVEKKKYSGNGLLILKERIMAINGNVNIHSIPKEGTTIEIGIKQAS